MNKFQYKLAHFMMGRRGFDQFSRDLIVLAMLLVLLDIFLPKQILSTLGFLIIIYAYYRAFSRNLVKRQEENNWYITYVGSKLGAWRQRDYKHYRYFKCPNCKQTLRAPKGRGKIRVTCSRCHNVFEKKV